ncbi:hypothetical protein CR513_07140, partial [Mucuna pruriens]
MTHQIYKQKVSSILDEMNFLLSLMLFLMDKHTNSTFQVNGHQIKLFHEGPTPITSDMETISLMEPAPLNDTP